jgi:DNA (cytosine-5)-methyltransferase 1
MADGSVLRDRQVLSADTAAALPRDSGFLGRVDVLTAGYPCQPFSSAARGRNNADDLWPEALRIIRSVRPRWVVLENVPGARLAHIERSCDELEALDYTVWPLDIAVPINRHVRRRIYVVAHSNSEGEPQCPVDAQMAGISAAVECRRGISYAMGSNDGLPEELDPTRMRALGNAIEPAIAQLIFRAIAAMNKERM